MQCSSARSVNVYYLKNWFKVVFILDRYREFVCEFQAALQEISPRDELLIGSITELSRAARDFVSFVLKILERSKGTCCCVYRQLMSIIEGRFSLPKSYKSDKFKKRIIAAALVIRYYVDREVIAVQPFDFMQPKESGEIITFSNLLLSARKPSA